MRILMYELFYRLQPIVTLPQKQMGDIFFIVGSQRSGSTLLRLILNSHPSIFVRDEDTAYKTLRRRRIDRTCAYVGCKIPAWTHKYRQLKRTYPSAKYLFIHRDIRAIASSMLTLKLPNGTSWLQSYGFSHAAKSIASITDSSKTFLIQYAHRYRKTGNLAGIAALCAFSKCLLYSEYSKRNLDVFKIQYEQFIQTPRTQLQTILEYLGAPWHDNVLSHNLFHHGVCYGNTDAGRSIDRSSLFKWKTRLTSRQYATIDDLLSSYEAAFGRPFNFYWDDSL